MLSVDTCKPLLAAMTFVLFQLPRHYTKIKTVGDLEKDAIITQVGIIRNI